MNYIIAKNRVLHRMREFSNAGTITQESKNRDYLLSMPSLFNQVMDAFVMETKALKGQYRIALNNPDNLLGRDEWNEIVFHDKDDIEFIAQGALAYSFQVGGNATVYIEEEINGTYTLLNTITHVKTLGEGFVQYKGILTPSDVSNNIRIRFSGEYYYPFRWVGMFSQKFAMIEDVPSFQPRVPYIISESTPERFCSLEAISFTHPVTQYSDYALYKLETEGTKTTALIDWYAKGEMIIKYFAYPEQLIENSQDLNINDSYEFPFDGASMDAIIAKVASELQIDDNTYISERLREDFVIGTNSVSLNKQQDTGIQTIQNVTGW